MKYVSVKHIATQLGVSRATAYRIAAQCVHVRAGRSIRVPEDAFLRYLAQNTNTPEPWAPSTSDDRAARTTGTGPTSRTGTNANRSARAIRKSPEQGSDNLNWYRPIQQRTRGIR